MKQILVCLPISEVAAYLSGGFLQVPWYQPGRILQFKKILKFNLIKQFKEIKNSMSAH